MAKKFKIKKQDYYDKNDIQIEISEEITQPVEVRKIVVSVANLKETIKVLKEKRQLINDEIDQNQSILDSLKTDIDNVVIKEDVAFDKK